MIGMPHFKTNVDQQFTLQQIDEAIAYTPKGTDKAV